MLASISCGKPKGQDKDADKYREQLEQCLKPFEERIFAEMARMSKQLTLIDAKFDTRIAFETSNLSFPARPKSRRMLEEGEDYEEAIVRSVVQTQVSSSVSAYSRGTTFQEPAYVTLSPDLNEGVDATNSLQRPSIHIIYGSVDIDLRCFSSALVILNAVFIGLEVNTNLNYHLNIPPAIKRPFDIGNFVCCMCFALELVLRLAQHGESFCSLGYSGFWNCLDTSLVALQAVEEIIKNFPQILATDHPLFFSLRSWRILRVLRVLRVLGLADGLGMLVHAIKLSIHSVLWALALMFLLVYTFGVGFGERISAMRKGSMHDGLEYFFGDVPRIMLTLTESVLGGLSWDEAVVPLFNEVGWVSGMAFLCFVLIGFFALVNIATGIFIDNVTKSAAREEHRQAVKKFRSALRMEDASELNRPLSQDEFEWKVLNDHGLQEYFAAINVTPTI